MNLSIYKVFSDKLSEMTKYSINQKIYLKLALSCIIGFIIALIHYIFYNNEKHWYNLSETKKMSFIDCLCYTFTCWFTLGFGEVIPKSIPVKLLSVFIMFLAYVVLVN